MRPNDEQIADLHQRIRQDPRLVQKMSHDDFLRFIAATVALVPVMRLILEVKDVVGLGSGLEALRTRDPVGDGADGHRSARTRPPGALLRRDDRRGPRDAPQGGGRPIRRAATGRPTSGRPVAAPDGETRREVRSAER